jgi:hypothetical protein
MQIFNQFKLRIDSPLFEKFRFFVEKKYRKTDEIDEYIAKGDVERERDITLVCLKQQNEVLITRHFLYKLLMWLCLPLALLLKTSFFAAIITLIIGMGFFFLARHVAGKIQDKQLTYNMMEEYYKSKTQL